MKINILTIFPDYFLSFLATSIIKRAIENNLVEINIVDIRKFATDKHKITDDRPFGGGPGMVMKIEPIDLALKSLGVKKNTLEITGQNFKETKETHDKILVSNREKVKDVKIKNDGFKLKKQTQKTKILLTSAKGKLFNQNSAKNYSKLNELTIICGHYEGVDERVAENLVDEEIRIGDYVLTGGEPAATVIIDAVTRLLPKVLGNEASNKNESHCISGKLGFPQYTRPHAYKDWQVPEVLLSGNHEEIAKWRDKTRSNT